MSKIALANKAIDGNYYTYEQAKQLVNPDRLRQEFQLYTGAQDRPTLNKVALMSPQERANDVATNYFQRGVDQLDKPFLSSVLTDASNFKTNAEITDKLVNRALTDKSLQSGFDAFQSVVANKDTSKLDGFIKSFLQSNPSQADINAVSDRLGFQIPSDFTSISNLKGTPAWVNSLIPNANDLAVKNAYVDATTQKNQGLGDVNGIYSKTITQYTPQTSQQLTQAGNSGASNLDALLVQQQQALNSLKSSSPGNNAQSFLDSINSDIARIDPSKVVNFTPPATTTPATTTPATTNPYVAAGGIGGTQAGVDTANTVAQSNLQNGAIGTLLTGQNTANATQTQPADNAQLNNWLADQQRTLAFINANANDSTKASNIANAQSYLSSINSDIARIDPSKVVNYSAPVANTGSTIPGVGVNTLLNKPV